MSTAVPPEIEFPKNWHRRHLLDLESLSPEEISTILDVAQRLKEMTQGCRHKISLLAGKTCANLFF
jgi:aspartate carbamoyltransferase catalytic subunit